MTNEIRRITEGLCEIVREEAALSLSPNDAFDFEVGVSPIPQIDEEFGNVYLEVSVWAIMRLDCPEIESKSVLSISAPLEFTTDKSFRSAVERAMTELQFSRIAASFGEQSASWDSFSFEVDDSQSDHDGGGDS